MEATTATPPSHTLQVSVPEADYQRELVSCQRACPVHTDARGYVRAIAAGDFETAYLLARGPNPFASICGRICGAPCEAACRRGRIPRVDSDGRHLGEDRPVSIRALKRFVCERFGVENRDAESVLREIRNHRPQVGADAEEMAALLRSRLQGGFEPVAGTPVAVIGSGPAGLSAAHDLALMGFRPVVFESEPVAAGMLTLGVPAYRLPRELIRREVEVIEALGVEIRCGVGVGTDLTFAEIRQQFAAVVVAVGAKRSRELGLPGEAGPGVFGGVDVLRAVALDEPLSLGEDILVIGGGNVAYDVARTVVRQAAFDAARTVARLEKTRTVHLVSLEGLEEMPADTLEIVEGDEEGIHRVNGWGPVEIRRDGAWVTGVRFQKCLSVFDSTGRFAPRFDPDQTMSIDCDTVLIAAGQSPDLAFLRPGGEDIEEMRPGWPRVDPQSGETTAAGVFVAGDLAHGTRLLIDAVASGKQVARSVYRYVTGRQVQEEMLFTHLVLPDYRRELGYEKIPRVDIPSRQPQERLASADSVVEIGYDADGARREASRCLDCGVTPIFDGNRCVLCGGCVDVCPTRCLKIVSLSRLELDTPTRRCIVGALGLDADRTDEVLSGNSAILKDEDRCIRCALCAQRCPVEAIAMERCCFTVSWNENGGKARDHDA